MKKIILTAASVFLFAVVLYPAQSFAAPQCSGNTAGSATTDPACWTSYTYQTYDYIRTDTTPATCSWYLDCDNCSYPCGDGSGRACVADFYTNTNSNCAYSRWCTNMGGLPGTGSSVDVYDWVDHTGYTCHYISSVNTWSACSASNQYATSVTWSTTGGTSCSNVSTSRYCCTAPSSDITINTDTTGPVSVDAEDPLTIDWSFTNTDPGNGYSCQLTQPYDENFTSPQWLSTPILGVNSGTFNGRIDYAGPNPAYVHPYTISCTHTFAAVDACPSTSDTVNVAVTPLPLEVNIVDIPDPAQVVDLVQLTADVRRGVPDMSSGSPDYTITWTSSPTTITGGPGSYLNAALRQQQRRFGVVGFYDFTLTATDLWGNTASVTETLEVIDDREPQ